MGTIPKFTVAGVNPSPACTPLPLTAITELDPCEFVIVTLPLTFSAVVGLKATFIAFPCPGVSASGVVIPLVFTSLALTVICVIVTVAFPVLVTVTLLELELPALMLPKARLVGLADRVTEAATPVPVKGTLAGELGALLEMPTVPGSMPAVAGANPTLKEALFPGASVAGVASPFTEYPAPLTKSFAIVRDEDPVLVTLNVCDFVCPSTTLPKLNVAGETFRPACTPVPVKAIESGEAFASLVTVTVPEALAAVAGAKPTVRVTL